MVRYLQGNKYRPRAFLQILQPMKPRTRTAQTAEMFRPRLDEQLNMKHPLIRLAGLMDWELIEHHFARHFTSGRGRPALPPRLVAGGARQGSCRLIHAASSDISTAGELAVTTASRSGLRVTAPSGDQSRVEPDQRAGLASRARAYSAWRAARIA